MQLRAVGKLARAKTFCSVAATGKRLIWVKSRLQTALLNFHDAHSSMCFRLQAACRSVDASHSLWLPCYFVSGSLGSHVNAAPSAPPTWTRRVKTAGRSRERCARFNMASSRRGTQPWFSLQAPVQRERVIRWLLKTLFFFQ